MRTRLLLLLAIIGLSLMTNQVKAQYQLIPEPTPNMYDTLYVFDTTYIANCFQSIDSSRIDVWMSDSVHRIISIPYSKPFAEFGWYSALKAKHCDSTAPVPTGYVIGSNNYNGTQYAEAFAQKYHLEDMPENYTICGVAIKLGYGALDAYRGITIFDEYFDTVATTVFHTSNIIPDPFVGTTVYWNRGGWNIYYFRHNDYEILHNFNDFYIAFDVPLYGGGNTFRVAHTCNIESPCIYDWIMEQGGPLGAGYNYDSIRTFFFDRQDGLYYAFRDTVNNLWYDTSPGWLYFKEHIEDTVIPLCRYSDPKFIRNSKGHWVNFVDDPVYEIYRNIYIAMVPIIMVPKTEQSLSEAELAKMCYLYPNPTRESFRVLSHYNIESVQVLDVSGREVRAQSVRHFETTIDVRDLPQGTYIVKIHTSKGTDEKKLIVQ